MMKIRIVILLLFVILGACRNQKISEKTKGPSRCNPIDLSYRFCLDEPSRREAADPTVVWFADRYFLFASKSGGYWHSADLTQWDFIETDEIPVEEYAPTAIALGDTLYFLASSNERSTLYQSTDPLAGKWKVAREALETPVWDPAFFLDDDGRLYLYWGCSNVRPIYGVEVDYRNHFSFIGKPTELIHARPEHYGWEVPGDENTLIHQNPWIEGAWMNKHNGNYYLQYAGPGTEYKSYSDGVYVSAQPLGPYVLQEHNPFAAKAGGFACGAGHGSTFADRYGNFWHIGTVTISVKHLFERRLALYPTFFDEEGILYADTRFGDYPMLIPQKKVQGFDDLFPGWMLLSYQKEVETSSSVDSLPPSFMTDEDIRTYWSAQSGQSGEWAIIDLGSSCDVFAIQINFAEHQTSLFDLQKEKYHRYTLETSSDRVHWEMLADRSNNQNDRTHPYLQLPEKVNCRYLKINNIEVPDGTFAVSGFRVFGKGNASLPKAVTRLQLTRNTTDRRSIHLAWDKKEHATGYLIRYGAKKENRYLSHMVYSDTSLTINNLNSELSYYFSVD
ncbi:MAG TPA: family 43 glycosylhydrolase, partial [Prolixibacteraceae bacterium]|nr:family 43 glycosylhydrolase [Prolixibacteraceae bacterium]